MERHFDEELQELNTRLLHMSTLVEKAIRNAVMSLSERNGDLAEETIRADDAIDLLEVQIDELCVRLLALYQPVATDLRFITSAMEINKDLERIGDQAVNIAERTQEVIKLPIIKPLIDIPRLAELSQLMVKDSINSLVTRDEELAIDVCKRDDEVDNINEQIFRELLTYMIEDTKVITRAVELILVGRHLERIADHATNIAECVIFLLKGEWVKHHYGPMKE
ncbi:MAG: phosphate transport system regulatory protein PhoU [Candidatus Scalindua sp. AMX11]|nr:MAG: phosphate transport system regulatory protein PhoU [Candidatus Scalindua sp.]NOG83235.1 phosphate signaling complex protein PhoU [Planctomycetota bacterium]RZV77596.1 MAG: phosphate signaling complex protein PhoU [Candidatus Scalindua sp. SCAELEC01]TDE63509.1 MAG: phosphate transport system regulatory protein PhoU [Candidatus Scalindua sp. AMX11]GJQ58666.1 MAG: phosphate transport system regulatory protein PhoU [Candidatus Scalindua sp.]